MLINLIQIGDIHTHVSSELIPRREQAQSDLTEKIAPLKILLPSAAETAKTYVQIMADISILLTTIITITNNVELADNIYSIAKVDE